MVSLPPRRKRFLEGLGWWWTVILMAPVAAVLVVGFLTRNPTISPAPAGYAEAACDAIGELTSALEKLRQALDLAEGDQEESALADQATEHVTAAYADLADLPVWSPGAQLERQMAALSTNIEAAIERFPRNSELKAAEAAESVRLADEIRTQVDLSLENGEYGFDCA